MSHKALRRSISTTAASNRHKYDCHLPSANANDPMQSHTWNLPVPVRRPGCLTAIDLFAGCGGTSFGLRNACFEVRAAVEIDRWASKSYLLNMGIRPIIRDIGWVSGYSLLRRAGLRPRQRIVLAACPPCQGFTRHRPGKEASRDPRNRLLRHVLRLAHIVRPRYLLFENVPGLKTGAGSTRYERFIAGMLSLGYTFEDCILDAADYGVPQHRRRLIALFCRIDCRQIRLPAPTHCDPGKTRFGVLGLKSWNTCEVIRGLVSLNTGESDPLDPLHRFMRTATGSFRSTT